MKYKPLNLNCTCGNPRRSFKQRMCNDCHARSQKEYRKRMKQKLQQFDGLPYVDAVREFKRQYILNAIRDCKGNLVSAAIVLRVHRNTVNRLMLEVGLSMEDVRQNVKNRQGVAA